MKLFSWSLNTPLLVTALTKAFLLSSALIAHMSEKGTSPELSAHTTHPNHSHENHPSWSHKDLERARSELHPKAALE